MIVDRVVRAGCLVVLAALACTSSSRGHSSSSSDVAVSISPQAVTLVPNAQRAFQAAVTGTADTSVSWTVAEGAAGGTVTTTGSYTAPGTEGTYHVVVTSAADPTKSATAQIVVAAASADLCAGLVQDKLPHAMSAVAKPAAGQSYVDPEFGTTIRRISDAPSSAWNVIKPMYSTIPAWNADESYLILYHTDGAAAGHHLYDGKTYAHIKELDIRPADLEQVYWDTTDPKILYYTDIVTHELHRFDVDTDTNDTSLVVRDFSLAPVSCADDITGGTDPLFTSWDSRFFGYTCGRGAGAKLFTYDRGTNTVGSVVVMNTGGNAPQPAPSGNLFFLNSSDTVAEVRDANMNLLRTLNVSPAEHATLGTADGVDTHFSIQFDVAPYGNVIAVDMTSGAKRELISESTGWTSYPVRGAHLSAVAYKNPGWLVTDIVGEATGQTLLDNEVVLVDANAGGSICRIAHSRSCGSSDNCGTQGYWAEPHATISPSGTRILFGSDWGGGPTVDSYVIELPSYTP